MNKQIRKLTWKYFRQQKWKEIKDWWDKCCAEFVALTFLIGLILQFLWITNMNTDLPIWKTGAIIGLFIMGFWILILIIILIQEVIDWLRSNWKKALKKAKKEFKGKKGGGK